MNEELLKTQKEKEKLKRKLDLKTEEDLRRKEYLDERKLLVKTMLEESKLFDTNILTLAAGALGLSLTFIKNIAPNNPKVLFMLTIAWLGFWVSTCSTLSSFLVSQDACLRQIEIIGADLEDSNQDRKNTHENKLTIWVRRLNIISIISFIIGVIFLIFFTIYNL